MCGPRGLAALLGRRGIARDEAESARARVAAVPLEDPQTLLGETTSPPNDRARARC
jgi:hypothetical protein